MCKRGVCGTRILIILLLPATVTAASCDELQCLNSNPCQSLLSRDGAAHAHCVCGGKWAGPRCQYQLRLKTEAVTSSTVKLTVDLMTSQNDNADAWPKTSEEALTTSAARSGKTLRLNYTLMFWEVKERSLSTSVPALRAAPRSDDVSCVLLHGRTSPQPTLQGLGPNLRYTACIETGSMDSCIFLSSSVVDQPFSSSPTQRSTASRMTSSWPSNCVTFRTRDELGGEEGEAQTGFSSSSGGVAVVSVMVVVVVVLMVGVGVAQARRCRALGGGMVTTSARRTGRWQPELCGCWKGLWHRSVYLQLPDSRSERLGVEGESGVEA